MYFRKKRFPLLLLLLLVCITRADAQYYAYWMDRQEIATDYNTCLQGVKDFTGKWIIQPHYEYIETDDGRYIVSVGTLITYVNSHQYIEGDCHNPAGIPEMLKHDFEITPNGLALYPAGFEEKGKQLVLHIAWNELDPYLRNDIRSRLPVTQH